MGCSSARGLAARVRPLSVSLAALAISSLFAASANAQDAAAAEPDTPAETGAEAADGGETIIVTGSRLARTTFNSPTPVTVLGGEDFDRLQITNVGEGVAELP